MQTGGLSRGLLYSYRAGRPGGLPRRAYHAPAACTRAIPLSSFPSLGGRTEADDYHHYVTRVVVKGDARDKARDAVQHAWSTVMHHAHACNVRGAGTEHGARAPRMK